MNNRITINRRVTECVFQFRLVAVGPTLGDGVYVWLTHVSPAMYQYMKIISMWGGPTKDAVVNGVRREAWEIHEQDVQGLKNFIRRSRQYRDEDAVKWE